MWMSGTNYVNHRFDDQERLEESRKAEFKKARKARNLALLHFKSFFSVIVALLFVSWLYFVFDVKIERIDYAIIFVMLMSMTVMLFVRRLFVCDCSFCHKVIETIFHTPKKEKSHKIDFKRKTLEHYMIDNINVKKKTLEEAMKRWDAEKDLMGEGFSEAAARWLKHVDNYQLELNRLRYEYKVEFPKSTLSLH